MSRVVQLNPTAKGLPFTRIAIAAALGRGDSESMETHARRLYGEKSLPMLIAAAGGLDQLAVAKAEVAAGATVSGNWAEILTASDGASAEFFALVRERSILGRLPGLRRIPLQTRIIEAVSGFTAAWVGEGKAVPVSGATYAQKALPPLKVAALTVQTDELLRSIDPAAEIAIRDDLVNAVVAAINESFLDPENDGEAGVEPASITYGAPDLSATNNGSADLKRLIKLFPGSLERAVLIGSPTSFAALHDPDELPGLGVRGGNALGIPAVAIEAAGTTLTLIDPAGIAIGEGSTDLRVATHANIEMLDSDLTGDAVGVVPPTAASTVSLWQTNSVALMAEQFVNWKVARPSVAVLEGVDQS
jgi:hypothetical protein